MAQDQENMRLREMLLAKVNARIAQEEGKQELTVAESRSVS